MPVYPSGGTIAQSVGSPGFGPAPAPSYTSPGSVRFNPADSAYFSYTPTLQGSRTTWTWAGWVKRSALGNTYQELFGTPNGSSDSTFLALTFGSNGIADTLGFQIWNSTYRTTTQLFRDPSQWYHIVCAVDTTQATAADRVKLYANGTQITAFSTSNNPAQFAQLSVNVAGSVHAIGRDLQQSVNFGGYMAEVYFVDGQALTPASFTETSSTTGQLIPISTGYTGVYGTNGFYLPFSSNALAVDLGQNKKVTGQDGYWPYNTLLVNTTNTNGQQNNTFLDSSTNNFTITRNGNTTQGQFGPFEPGGGTTQANGYFSNYFDGTGDFLSIPTTTNTNLHQIGNWTYEGWIQWNIMPSTGYQNVFGQGAAGQNSFGLTVYNGSSWSAPYYFVVNQANIGNVIVGKTILTAGVWYHFAVVRNSGVVTLYVNGSAEGTYSNSTDYAFGGNPFTIGNSSNAQISNFRFVRSAVYTANFTVPTTPLTAITNTQLLTCQSSQFIDNSTNNYTITVNGNSQPTPANPFGMTAWSGYFDGTGDYLTAPSVTGTTLDGNFTIEYFMYRPASSNNWMFTLGDAFLSSGIETYIGTSGTLFNLWVSGANRVSSSVLPPVGIWSHVAVVRSGTTITLYLNGVSLGTYTSSTTFSGITYVGAERYNGSITGVFTGFLSNFRIVKGTALYTSTFTPPTAPLTAISGTQLLTCQSSTFVDTSPNALTITTNGNPYTLTLNNPFNSPVNSTPPTQSWSTYFDGNADYILSPAGTPTYGIGTGNWTWESWIYTTSTSTTQTVWFYYCTNTDVIRTFINGSTGVFGCEVRATNRTAITGSTPSGSIRLNQWHHIAAARDSATNITMYVDGKALATIALSSSATWADTTMFTGNPSIGSKTNLVGEYFAGHISNLRFVRGSAVYMSNFTPPTSPLTAIPGTMTLACQSNRVLDNSLLNVAQVLYGNTLISPLTPFIPTSAWTAASNGGSMYFDGTGDSLSIPGNSAFNFGTGNFTAEAWVYVAEGASEMSIIDFWINGGGSYLTGQWQLCLYTSNSLTFVWASGPSTAVRITTPSNTLPRNNWTHVAITRTGNLFQLFTNGVLGASTTLTQAMGTTSSGRIGIQTVNNAVPFSGYIANARILKGTSLYTTTFVPPVLPPTAVANTQLLLNATNAGIYDATGLNNIETFGNAQASTAVKKWGETSVSFDGSGDYLTISNASNSVVFGTSDFTIELWVYFSSFSNNPIVYDARPGGTNGAYVTIYALNNAALNLFVNSADRITSSALSINTWYHVAISRVSSSTRMFINGTQAGVTYSDSTNYINGAGRPFIGLNSNTTNTSYFSGYMQDLRISRVGRYSGNFTPPAAAFAYNVQDVGFQQWLPTNISVTAGVGNDSLTDTVSDSGIDTGVGGQVRGNYCTVSPLSGDTNAVVLNGNLTVSGGTSSGNSRFGTFGVSSGKWYFEHTMTTIGVNGMLAGVTTNVNQTTALTGGKGYYFNGTKFDGGTSSAYGASFTTGDIIGVALDMDAGSITFYKNGVSQGVAFTGLTGTYFPLIRMSTATQADMNFGQRAFGYAAPAGHKCLVSTNLPVTNGIGSSASTQATGYFNPVIWTGNSSQVNVGFNPELLWYKARNAVDFGGVVDVLRGDTKYLQTYSTNAEGTQAGLLTTNSTGFVPGSGFSTNNYVAWNWKANGAGVTNTAGSITSTVSANTTSGFSVVSYTGTGANATVGHGLGVAPSMVIVKCRTQGAGYNWGVYHTSIGAGNVLLLNGTSGSIASSAVWNNTAPTSSVFSVGTDNAINQNIQTYIAYCFAPVAGYNAFGSYTGNGSSTQGPLIYTGFRPAFVMIKSSSFAADWVVYDDARNPSNLTNLLLRPNSSAVEATGVGTVIDMVSNGFLPRNAGTEVNQASATYVYAAFAEFPFKYSRAR